MSSTVLIVDKPIGVTPLEVIKRIQVQYPMYKKETISYAGRLDPMAHGVLVLLVGAENKKRDDYLHMDKIYQVEILFGLQSDSYDILGLVSKGTNMLMTPEKFQRVLPRFEGKRIQKYPPFSSKPVNGKPLFYWARENRLNDIHIPQKEITIHSLQYISLRTISGEDLVDEVRKKIQLVSGDFRQKQIQQAWEDIREPKQEYYIASCTVFCSSGTYVRSITHDVGKYIGCGALAFDIFRTQVGTFSITDAIDVY